MQTNRLKHIYFERDRDEWRVRDDRNKIGRRGFTTQYDAWVWRQTERAARGLPVINDAPASLAEPVAPAPAAAEVVYQGMTAALNGLAPPTLTIKNHELEVVAPLTVPAGNVLVLADLHCPYHDGEVLEAAFNHAYKASGGRFDAVIAGDIFDFAEISRHPKDEREETTELTIAVAGRVLSRIAAWLPGTLYILPGNHDRRLARSTGLAFAMDDLLALAFKPAGIPSNVKYTGYDYILIDHADVRRRWLVGHPRNYSQQGGFTAARLAQLRQTNVITAHDHTAGEQMSVDGRWRGISCGHTTRAELHNYKRASLSIHREWTAGYVMLTDGVAERIVIKK